MVSDSDSDSDLVIVNHPITYIIGSGVSAYTVAVRLLSRNKPVHLLTLADLTAQASAGAGGLWMPFHAGGEENSATVELYSKWAKATFDEYEMNNRNAARSAFLPTDKSVVEMVEVNSYSSETESPYWASITSDFEIVDDSHRSREYCRKTKFTAPIIDCPAALIHYEQTCRLSSLCTITQVEEKFNDAAAVVDFINSSFENGAESNDFTVVNCAGASGHLLSGGTDNSENFVARGILHLYEREKCNDKAALYDSGSHTNGEDYPTYCIPRGNVVVVGGCYIKNDFETTIRANEAEFLTKNTKLLLGETKTGKKLAECERAKRSERAKRKRMRAKRKRMRATTKLTVPLNSYSHLLRSAQGWVGGRAEQLVCG